MRLWITNYRLMQGTPSLPPRCRWDGRLDRFVLANIRNLSAETAGSEGGEIVYYLGQSIESNRDCLI